MMMMIMVIKMTVMTMMLMMIMMIDDDEDDFVTVPTHPAWDNQSMTRTMGRYRRLCTSNWIKMMMMMMMVVLMMMISLTWNCSSWWRNGYWSTNSNFNWIIIAANLSMLMVMMLLLLMIMMLILMILLQMVILIRKILHLKDMISAIEKYDFWRKNRNVTILSQIECNILHPHVHSQWQGWSDVIHQDQMFHTNIWERWDKYLTK